MAIRPPRDKRPEVLGLQGQTSATQELPRHNEQSYCRVPGARTMHRGSVSAPRSLQTNSDDHWQRRKVPVPLRLVSCWFRHSVLEAQSSLTGLLPVLTPGGRVSYCICLQGELQTGLTSNYLEWNSMSNKFLINKIQDQMASQINSTKHAEKS